MTGTPANDRLGGEELRERRLRAIWKWQWLGWRDSTPAFKASLFLLAAIALALVAYVEVR